MYSECNENFAYRHETQPVGTGLLGVIGYGLKRLGL